jgi:hypothetical protein
VCAGVAAGAGSSPGLGDLLVGAFFAVMGLLLWTHSTRIRYAQSVPPLTPNLAIALGLAFGLGVLLVAIDLISGGAL